MFTHFSRCLVLAICLPATIHVARAENSSENIRRHIDELGSRSFGDREAASQALLDLDVVAIPLLREAAQSEEAEVRGRAKRLLTILEQRDFDLRLSKFSRDYDDSLKLDFPGWKEYRKLVGDDREARDFFVGMQRAEQHLLAECFNDPAKSDVAIAARLTEQFQNQALNLRKTGSSATRPQTTIESVAAIWLIASEPQVELNAQSNSLLCNAFYQSGAINKVRDHEPSRRLLKCWINGEIPPEIAPQILNIANQLELPEASELGRKILENTALHATVRIGGLQAVIQSRKKEALPILEKYLTDTALTYQFFPNGRVQVNNGKQREPYKVQFRDLVMVQMVALCEQKGDDFDIKAPLPNDANRWTVEFQKLLIENDTDREAMHKKWDAWWQAHRADYLPKKAANVDVDSKRDLKR